MAVSDSTGFSGPYTANGSTKVFPFGFQVLATSQVSVVSRVSGVDTVVSPSAYTVSLTGAAPSAGSVTFTTAPASGAQIFVLLNPSFASDAAFENGSAWLAKPVNDGYDASALRDMVLRRDVARSMLAPIGETIGTLPNAASRAGKVLAFDVGTGAPVAGPDFGSLGTIGAALTAIGTVSASIASVNTVAAAESAVTTAATNIASINTVASNIAAVNAAAGNAASAAGSAAAAALSAGNAAISEANAASYAASAINAPGTSADSTTSLLIGTGSKSLIITAGKAFSLGQFVILASKANPANYMIGQISGTGYNPATGSLAVTVSAGGVGGSGTYADWTISLTAAPVAAGAYLQISGGTMAGPLGTAASAAGGSGFNLPPGVAPTTPVNGDFWSTASGFFARVNGATVGPFLDSSGFTMSGKITAVASAAGGAGFALPHGAAPTSPVNGDVWTTTGGFFVRVNGVTQQYALTTHTHTSFTNLTLTTPTITNPNTTGSAVESVYAITDGVAFEINPANGSIQTITLGANRTPKGTSFANGQSVTLVVDDGTAFTLTWSDTTFGPSGVKWLGGSAPSLATTGLTWITLFKVGGQVYGTSPGASA